MSEVISNLNKIIIKKGKGKPNNTVLDEGEFGLATDTRKVYIGAYNDNEEKVIIPVTGATVDFDNAGDGEGVVKYFVDAQKLDGIDAEHYATKDFVEEEISKASIGGGGSGGGSIDGGNADTLDGYHASDFALKDQLNQVQTNLDNHNLSENSHPDIRELISSVPDRIYKQNEEPADAPEGALWVDLDAKTSGGGSEIPIEGIATEDYVNEKISMATDSILAKVNENIEVAKNEVVSHINGTFPTVTAEDNGKFLRVVDGKWAAASIPYAEGVRF